MPRWSDSVRSVKPAVEGLFVLAAAVGAHVEAPHSGVGAIVGERGDDAETRSAIRAIGEGVGAPPILWVKNLREAFVAGGDIGQHDRGLGAALLAVANRELREAVGLEPGLGRRWARGGRVGRTVPPGGRSRRGPWRGAGADG